jgi:chromate transporter
MIYLRLFLTFLKIGAVSFGGGYGMIPLVREECILNGWLSDAEILNFIAIAESTPGPIAVNMATFVGSSQAGIGGALLATLGAILPAFLIILLITTVMGNLLKYAGVKAALGGVRPVAVGLILATAVTTLLNVVFSIQTVSKGTFSFDWRALVIFAAVVAVYFVYKRLRKKALSPILLIVMSGVLGVLLYL